jgi:hypothetical protein
MSFRIEKTKKKKKKEREKKSGCFEPEAILVLQQLPP